MEKSNVDGFKFIRYFKPDSETFEQKSYQHLIRSRLSNSDKDTTSCPRNLIDLKQQHSYLSSHPACPWYFVRNIDRTRYPSMIYEARCRCRSCLNITGRSTLLMCQRVYSKVYVINDVKLSNGKLVGRRGFIRVAKSCACVLPTSSNLISSILSGKM